LLGHDQSGGVEKECTEVDGEKVRWVLLTVSDVNDAEVRGEFDNVV
jgi:hypothetical protein